MPDAIITSTASTFGTISGTFAADQSTITGTVSGIVPGTLTGSVGVPGPAGSPGAPGPGVPAGGTAGQFLQKIDGTNYNTDWVTLNLSAYALLSGASFSGFCDFINGLSSSGPVTLLDSGYLDASGLDGDSRRRIRFGAGNGGGFWGWGDFGFDGSNLRFGNNENLPETLATRSWVTAGFYPLTGNPSGFITSAALSGYAPLASPAFTGNPTAPTAALGDNDTSLATTAFVQQELLSGTANARNLEVYVRNQTGSTIPAGSIVYINGATGNRPTITLAQANNDANSAQTFGFTKASIANNGFGFVIVRGELENIDTSALTEGVQLYLSPTTAGAYTTTKPSAPQHLVYVGICVRAHPTQGVILVAVQNGYELEELHDVAIGTLANNDLLAYESSTDLWKNKTFSALGLLTSADAASTYAPIASPTFTGTVTIPAGASISGFAPLASPAFTGTPSLPTGTTGVTQTAGNNTTAVATTAFVTTADNLKANLASPTFTGTPTAPIPGISTRTAQLSTRSDTWATILSPGLRITPLDYVQSAVTGTGALFSSFQPSSSRLRGPNALTVGSALQRSNNSSTNSNNNALFSRGINQGSINWTKPVAFAIRCMVENTTSGTIFRITVGKVTGASTGDLTTQGIGVKQTGTGALVLQSHNGTTLTSTTSSFTPTASQSFDLEVYSDGAGNAYLYVNDSEVATNAGAPTTANTSNGGQYMLEVVSDGTQASQAAYYFSTQKIFYGV